MDNLSIESIGMVVSMIVAYFEIVKMVVLFTYYLRLHEERTRKRKRIVYTNEERVVIRKINMRRIIYESDGACVENCRMDRRAFYSLCDLLENVGGLRGSRFIDVEEMVAFFLHIVAHDIKNRIMRRQIVRSGETISRNFKKVLRAIIKCQAVLRKEPEPVREDSNDIRWKWFKNCLGALDGTYIKVNVLNADKPRYRTRKNEIATNVLGVCSQDMQFIYIFPGWEGSAADSRVLHDALSRRNGLKIFQGHYYLCDAGYPNCPGLLTPYRGQRYHLNDWRQGGQPSTPQELFNYKHSSARNVIERCFGLLKGRWAILRGKSYYPVKVQCQIILTCALLHNHIRREMAIDPFEIELEDQEQTQDLEGNTIRYVEVTNEWTMWRDNLAQHMFNEWRNEVPET